MNQVAVIIVTYNGEKWIDKCLKTLGKSSIPLEVVVFDNQSTDDTVEIVSRFSEVHLMRSEKNLGFGKANNEAIKWAYAKGFAYFFLLNQDTWVEENSVEILLNEAEKNPSYGIVSPMHYSGNQVNLDENFAKYYTENQDISSEFSKIPFVNAAAWLVSRACFEKVGFFEKSFSHYGEDRNYANRVLYHGFGIGVAKQSKIYHDRVIRRNARKDLLQSEFLVLNDLININLKFPKNILMAIRRSVGIPLYFGKQIGWKSALSMAFSLSIYTVKNLFGYAKLSKIRKTHQTSFKIDEA